MGSLWILNDFDIFLSNQCVLHEEKRWKDSDVLTLGPILASRSGTDLSAVVIQKGQGVAKGIPCKHRLGKALTFMRQRICFYVSTTQWFSLIFDVSIIHIFRSHLPFPTLPLNTGPPLPPGRRPGAVDSRSTLFLCRKQRIIHGVIPMQLWVIFMLPFKDAFAYAHNFCERGMTAVWEHKEWFKQRSASYPERARRCWKRSLPNRCTFYNTS